jgi:MoaA/NifB/PqqE/SkfB family radical SAM enzyme
MTSAETLAVDERDSPCELPHRSLDFIWLEITSRCNLKCSHCYADSGPNAQTLEIVDWMSVLQQASEIGCRNVQFIGGEPCTHPKLIEYIEAAARTNFEIIEVYTNLTIISDDLLDAFARHGVRIATSFYNSDFSVHDSVTGVRGSFNRTTSGMRQILNARIPLRVGLIDMGTRRDTGGAVELLETMGVDRQQIRVDHIRPVGRGNRETCKPELRDTLCGECWKGKLAIVPTGDAFPCVFARSVAVGNALRQELQQIVCSEALASFRTSCRNWFPQSRQCGPNCQPDLGPPPRPCAPSGGCTPGCGPCAP